MNAYRLHAILFLQEYNFDFLAESDDEARRMVDTFYKVCHPMSHGPLWRVGKEEVRNGIKAVYLDAGEPTQFVPLEIVVP